MIPVRSRLKQSLCLLVLATVTLAGCDVDMANFWAPQKNPATQPASTQAQAQLPRNFMQLTVFKITLPLGVFSGDEKLWELLDQDVLESGTSVMLAHNGLRAGVGTVNTWEQLRKRISDVGASFSSYQIRTDGRMPVLLPTQQSIAEQILFVVDQDKRPLGRTYNNCDNSWRVNAVRQTGDRRALVQIEPVVLLGTAVHTTRTETELGVVSSTSRQEETLAPARLALEMDATQFLLLAPANPTKAEFSIGTRFLSDTTRLPVTETILVLVPG
jgi:hypothetical protein